MHDLKFANLQGQVQAVAHGILASSLMLQEDKMSLAGPCDSWLSVRRLLGVGCLLFIVMVSIRPALAQSNAVLRWNDVLLQAVRNTKFPPVCAARALAIVHTSMYDAWAAYDGRAMGTRYGGSLRRPVVEHTEANKQRAISFAAYRSLIFLFPTQKTLLFDTLMASLGYNSFDTSTDTTTPTGIGNVTAAAVLAFRRADGSNQFGDLHPGAYSDYTGYAPEANNSDHHDPNIWRPLRNPNGTFQKYLAPHWGLVTAFALSPNYEFRPEPPPMYPKGLYLKDADQILHFSAQLDDLKKVIAEYWADGPGSETPPGHWNLFAQFVSERDGHTLDQDVKLFFALGNALLDASIAVWDCKRFYDYLRPVSAVAFLYKDKQVRAWGGPHKGTQLVMGQNFRSYIPTPPFAEYVSGHSAFSSASAEVLKLFTGSDRFGDSAKIRAGSSKIEPDVVPAVEITLSWKTFSAAADEAGMSRRYGGIHFEQGDLQARALGRKVGAKVWAKAQTYFNGTAKVVETVNDNVVK